MSVSIPSFSSCVICPVHAVVFIHSKFQFLSDMSCPCCCLYPFQGSVPDMSCPCCCLYPFQGSVPVWYVLSMLMSLSIPRLSSCLICPVHVNVFIHSKFQFLSDMSCPCCCLYPFQGSVPVWHVLSMLLSLSIPRLSSCLICPVHAIVFIHSKAQFLSDLSCPCYRLYPFQVAQAFAARFKLCIFSYV